MGKVNTRTHIGDLLCSRGVITDEQLSMALKILSEEPEHSNRRIGQILYQDLNLDRHEVMRQIADIYAFDEVFAGRTDLPPDKIQDIKSYMDDLPQETVDELAHQKAVPIHKTTTSLTIAAADPSDPKLSGTLSRLNFKEFDIQYCRYEMIEYILSNVYEQKNEFLDLLEEIDYEEPQMGDDTQEVDEEEIEAEIN